MTRKKVRTFLLAALIVISLIFLLDINFIPGLSLKSSSYEHYKLLGKVMRLIKDDYIEEPNPTKTMKGAFKGLINPLDILSCYLDKESSLKYNQRKEAKLKDIGVVLYKEYGYFPRVVGIVENSPAEKKGIQIGDIFSALDDRLTLTMSLIETHLYLKDREKNLLRIRILRGGKTQEMGIERTLLFKEAFSYTLKENTGGLLKIHHLYPPCVSKIKEKIIPRLKLQKKALILDLRNCHEGDIEEARKLINLFMKAREIGYFTQKKGTKQILSCPQNPELEKLPLIIWTNQATIGAAEIVAGVLKEFKKAKIVGLTTPGLVAKQIYIPLENGDGILLTSGIFYLKSEKTLWKKGVEPDIKITEKNPNFTSYLKRSLSY
jgi:C-terminal peptidase prc